MVCRYLGLLLLLLAGRAVSLSKPNKQADIQVHVSQRSCPPGVVNDSTCGCGFLTNTSLCSKGYVTLPFCYCLSYSDDFNTTVVGYCAVRCNTGVPKTIPCKDRYQIVINKSVNFTEFNNVLCSDLHMYRTGQMCGSCVKGYAPPVYSYSLECVSCTDYKYNWLKYIAIAYLPLTAFFVIVTTFRISAASSAMNGFVLTSQIIASPTVTAMSKLASYQEGNIIVIMFYGIWNLDFFRGAYAPFCLDPSMSVIQIRALDYVVAVYPLILIFITYMCVSLHYRYSIVVRLWRPFYRCFIRLRKEWNIKTSLIGAFATFILLSYVKILNISFELLAPVTLYDVHENRLPQLYLSLDATVKYFGKDHLPYAILALVMTFTFNILPLALMCLYPCKCFHRCLNYFKIQRETLREFMEVFIGELKYQPRDFRYFAAYFLFIRIVNFVLLYCSNEILYFTAAAAFFAVSSVFIAIVKPYKSAMHNNIHAVLYVLTAMAFIGFGTHLSSKLRWQKMLWLSILSFHPLYGIGLLFYALLPKQRLKEMYSFIQQRTLITKHMWWFRQRDAADALIPYRLLHSDDPEYKPLLSPRIT